MKKRETHGKSKTKLYQRWAYIKKRCQNKKDYNYKYYGGRGIKICDEWSESYQSFEEWAINNGYKESLQIDRIDNDSDYCPENCRFVTPKKNVRNSPRTKLTWVKADAIRDIYSAGGTTTREIAKLFSISQAHVSRIISNYEWVWNSNRESLGYEPE